jgi:hypothetical protein
MARQIDVSEPQGQHIAGKSTSHHRHKSSRNILREDRLRGQDRATLDAKVPEGLWTNILNCHHGAGTANTGRRPAFSSATGANDDITAAQIA